MSSAAASTPNNVNQTPRSGESPGGAEEQKEEDVWSGDDDEEADGEPGDDSRKRKRQRTSRPLSVSCELCKSRKASVDSCYS